MVYTYSLLAFSLFVAAVAVNKYLLVSFKCYVDREVLQVRYYSLSMICDAMVGGAF